MDNEHRCRPFYDGEGYVRIPVDEYYDDEDEGQGFSMVM